jgi:hypothetical protein
MPMKDVFQKSDACSRGVRVVRTRLTEARLQLFGQGIDSFGEAKIKLGQAAFTMGR